MTDPIDNELRGIRTALNLRTYRQELLASNIANADTPNYKAKDVDFGAAMDNALAGRRGAAALSRTAPGHMGGENAGNQYGAAVSYRAEYQGAVDGNTVNMDVERGAFAENAIRVEAALTFIQHHFRDLQAAVAA